MFAQSPLLSLKKHCWRPRSFTTQSRSPEDDPEAEVEALVGGRAIDGGCGSDGTFMVLGEV